MAENTLNLQYSDLITEIAFYLGYGRGVPSDVSQLAHCVSILKGGMRQFYYPPNNHHWSFLIRRTSFTTTVTSPTTKKWELADDVGGLIGEPALYQWGEGASVANQWQKIKIIPWEEYALLIQQTETTGQPEFGSLIQEVSSGGDSTESNRWYLYLYPIPDAAYKIYYRYHVLPPAIDGSTVKYPIGGAQHANTILESCLAFAEALVNDEVSIHRNLFQANLVSSIAFDSKFSQPEYFGYNGDSSSDSGSVNPYNIASRMGANNLVTY